MEISFDKRWQLLCHVVIHVEVFVPGSLCSIAVMTRTVASCPVRASIRACLIDATRACVGEDHCDLALFGIASEARFVRSVFPVASKS